MHGQVRRPQAWPEALQRQPIDKTAIQNEIQLDKQQNPPSKLMSTRLELNEQVIEEVTQVDPKDHITVAKKMLANLRKVHRYES